jgi:hypothetical protein
MGNIYQPDFGEIAQNRAQSMNVLSQMRQRDQEVAQQNALAKEMQSFDFNNPNSMARIAGMPGGADAIRAYTGALSAKSSLAKADAEAQAAEVKKRAEAFGAGAHYLSMTKGTDEDLGNMAAVIRMRGGSEDEINQIVDFAQNIPFESRVAYLGQMAASDPNIRMAMDAFKPELKEVKTGDKVLLVDFNRQSPTFNQAVGEYAINASPDAILSATTQAQNRAQALSIANMEEEGRNARAAVTAGGPGSTTVTEDQAFYNVDRVLNNISALADLVEKDPKSIRAGMFESAAEASGAPGLANILRGSDRQIAAQSYDDIIDAILYLSTGAAYNKEQRAGMISAYRPNFTDKPEAVNAKFDRILGLLDGAKARSGANWTPEIDNQYRAAVEKLRSATLKATKSGGAGQQASSLPKAAIDYEITPEIWNAMTEKQRALFAD